AGRSGLDKNADVNYKPAVAIILAAQIQMARGNEGRVEMAKDQDENDDEKDFVFEDEGGLGGDPDEGVDEEIEEELVISESPSMAAETPQPVRKAAPKKATKKKAAKKAAPKAKVAAKKKAKPAPKKGKKPAKKAKKSGKRR